ncbi:MAG TPA: hypothetical protein VI758_08535, partial [Bacteroidota bacterium]
MLRLSDHSSGRVAMLFDTRLKKLFGAELFIAFLLISTAVRAQPGGESITGVGAFGSYQFVGTGRDFTFNQQKTSQADGHTYYSRVLTWRAPEGREIKGFSPKKGNIDVVFVLLDDGSVYETVYNSFLGWGVPTFRSKTDVSGTYSGFVKMVGDALYVLSTNAVFVSRDTAGTWSLDTAGVGGGFYNDIAVDTLQYVYLAHGNGLYKQHPDSGVWHKVASFPNGTATSVFVDRKNRLYAASYAGIVMSTDGGNTWTPDNSGYTAGSVNRFSDDAYHNVYALGGAKVFRSDSGTAPWVRIDTGITNLIRDPINSFLSPFTSIGGDSILFLGTSYGLFQSTDRGSTWKEDNSNNRAATLYGFARLPSRQFVSTALGLYARNTGDTVWTRTFPSTGYQTGGPIFVDNSGTVYTLGPIINFNNSQSPNANWKSTDNGTSWAPDTAGISAMSAGSIPKYLADETGVQHYAVGGLAAECYMKSSGSPWSPDTAGWGI